MNSILNRFEFRLEADKPTELNLYLYSQVRGGLAYDLAKGKFEESKTGASYFSKKLEEYKVYVKTKQFAEEVAKEKLGLVNPDEILLKPNK